VSLSHARLRTLARRLGIDLGDAATRPVVEARILAALPSARPQLAAKGAHLADVQRVLDFLVGQLVLDDPAIREATFAELVVLGAGDRLEVRRRARKILRRHSPRALLEALQRRFEGAGPRERRDALVEASDYREPEADALLLRALSDPLADIRDLACRRLVDRGSFRESTVRYLAQCDDSMSRSAAQAALEFADDLERAIERAFDDEAYVRDGARWYLDSRAAAYERDVQPLPAEFEGLIGFEGRGIAYALWQRRPVGWDVPERLWQRDASRRLGRKLIRRLRVAARVYHRRLLLSQLRRRPRTDALLRLRVARARLLAVLLRRAPGIP
jgi:hypothetical protein